MVREEAVRPELQAGGGLQLWAEMAILRTLPSGRAKQEPFKASQVGSPTRRKLDVEGDWLQMQQHGAEERENSKGRVGAGLETAPWARS